MFGYEPVDYDLIMNGQNVLIAGSLNTSAKETAEILRLHGATVHQLSFEHDQPHIAALIKQANGFDCVAFFMDIPDFADIASLDQYTFADLLTRNCIFLHTVTQAVLPYMRERLHGTFAAVIPDYAVSAVPGTAANAACAGAINAYVRALAIENCKYGIRANSILTGFSVGRAGEYYIQRYGTETAQDAFRRFQIIERKGEDSDVSNCVLFCLSPLSNSITGESFPLDGGALIIGHSQIWNPKDQPAFTTWKGAKR